jgi:predicted small lipoprotein YifL
MNKPKTLLLLCLLALFVVACGQRGPLFLPEPGPDGSETEKNEKNEEKDEETPGA